MKFRNILLSIIALTIFDSMSMLSNTNERGTKIENGESSTRETSYCNQVRARHRLIADGPCFIRGNRVCLKTRQICEKGRDKGPFSIAKILSSPAGMIQQKNAFELRGFRGVYACCGIG